MIIDVSLFGTGDEEHEVAILALVLATHCLDSFWIASCYSLCSSGRCCFVCFCEELRIRRDAAIGLEKGGRSMEKCVDWGGYQNWQ